MSRFRLVCVFSIVTLAALCAALPVCADDPPAATPAPAAATPVPHIDADALVLLKKAQTKMFGLKTYQAECQTTVTFDKSENGGTRPQKFEFATLTAAKPNFMRYDRWDAERPTGGTAHSLDVPIYTFVCDGKTKWQQFGKKYKQDKQTAPQYLHTLLEPWGGFYAINGSAYSGVEYTRKEKGLLEVRRDGSDMVGGVMCQKVFVHNTAQYQDSVLDYRTTWYFDNDYLLRRRIEWVSINQKPGNTSDAVLRNIKLNVPIASPQTVFAYTPPKGVKSEEQVERERPPLLAVGTAAPDFSAVDVSGNTVKLSDFKGKIVVLDFWASWCPPCVASMPHNQAVAQKLQAEGLPVVLLAADNSEEKPAFAAWVKKHGEMNAITFVFADPKTADVSGKLYRVTGIPSQFVLDAQGVIRASFVGYDGGTDALKKAIRAAAGQATRAANRPSTSRGGTAALKK